jgi:hypothetical protein
MGSNWMNINNQQILQKSNYCTKTYQRIEILFLPIKMYVNVEYLIMYTQGVSGEISCSSGNVLYVKLHRYNLVYL